METAHTFMWISSFLFKYQGVKELSGGMFNIMSQNKDVKKLHLRMTSNDVK